MKIYLETKNYADLIVVEAENVRIDYDVQKRTYPHKKEDGSTNYLKSHTDISDEGLDMVCSLLDDMLYYRQAEYNSYTTIIDKLIELLPEQERQVLLKKLSRVYGH